MPPDAAFVGGVSIKIDDATVFEPDALVNCGAPIPRHSLIAPNPVIVVEVISPTSTRRDLAVKFTNYFRHPGVQHYLVVVLENRTAIQHSRGGDALITRIAGVGDRGRGFGPVLGLGQRLYGLEPIPIRTNRVNRL